ncbi:hypothetical protein FACS189452_05260 [Bacteroidia bacterium]|nr:hypothetical protein FACS189452_05260 [Bacteroidia bacterium]GHT81025.1 hypothetical protein FACS189467_4380 [Bacteroidia bacterium]
MKYFDFEYIMSATRMNRYLLASGNNSKKAMTLYRKNLHLSQELFTVISCFEIALRNAIDNHYTNQYGSNWLRDSAVNNGIFDTTNCRGAKDIINSEQFISDQRPMSHSAHWSLVAVRWSLVGIAPQKKS